MPNTAAWNPARVTFSKEFRHRNLHLMEWVGWSFFWSSIVLDESSLDGQIKFFGTAVFLIAIAMAAYSYKETSKELVGLLRKELDWRIDVPSVARQYPVDICLYTNTVLTGEDQGLSCFDDYLIFQGVRTSFALRNSDVHLQWPGTQYTRKSPELDFLTWQNGEFFQRMRIRELDKSKSVFGVDPIQNDVRAWMSRTAKDG